VNVMPQIGSGIYTRWQPLLSKQSRTQRHFDGSESSGLDEDAARLGWELAIEVSADQMADHAAFFESHKGSGVPFYFYDLQNNNFQYDPTGTLEDGRYTVRFDTPQLGRRFKLGNRFELSYRLVEVA